MKKYLLCIGLVASAHCFGMARTATVIGSGRFSQSAQKRAMSHHAENNKFIQQFHSCKQGPDSFVQSEAFETRRQPSESQLLQDAAHAARIIDTLKRHNMQYNGNFNAVYNKCLRRIAAVDPAKKN